MKNANFLFNFKVFIAFSDLNKSTTQFLLPHIHTIQFKNSPQCKVGCMLLILNFKYIVAENSLIDYEDVTEIVLSQGMVF
jgi:hypothetical protein